MVRRCHHLTDAIDDVGVMCRDIDFLAWILAEVIELDGTIRHAPDISADALPIADADRLLATLLVKLPVQKRVVLLIVLAPQQRGQDRHAIGVLQGRSSREIHRG